MDSMLGENKNFKDISQDSIKDTSSVPMSMTPSVSPLRDFSGSYTKTNKLITALYMVTDTMETNEPIRLKLRTLGVEILSDINSSSRITLGKLDEKIAEVLSFMNIAFDIRMISEMNYRILKKEFLELKESIHEFTKKDNGWLGEFISKSSPMNEEIEHVRESKISAMFSEQPSVSDRKKFSPFRKGQSTRIGVQKGSTLLQALSEVGHKENFEVLKNKRRGEIISVIKNYPNGISIKDIMLAIRSLGEEWGEKTLQRELVSMVKDNVLKKTGEKRWSQYFLN
ncbi:MAG: hypothetical protein NDI62_00055 [Burkholderiales bacterium]|nr:hypothetical protein [Burkholderiales bacterium]